MRKYADIVERVEIIRNDARLNKSQFASAVGMKPQTYHNFIGAQGTKPSVDLIVGVVVRFRANPYWLLNGNGPVYQEGDTDGDSRAAGTQAIPSTPEPTSLPASRTKHLELVQDVIRALEELQVLLNRLQRDFSSTAADPLRRVIN